MALLRVDGISAGYGKILVLHEVSISVDHGEAVALIGANGAGKTTLMRTIMGHIQPIAGTVSLEGKVMTGLPAFRVARHGIAHVPEGRDVFPGMTVWENLRLGAYRHGKISAADFNQEVERVCELFPRLGERLKQKAGTLSGGEQQMLAIARALLMRPRVLLLDEPSLGLAPVLVDQMFDAIASIRDAGLPILLVEQNAFYALEFSQRAYVLETGRIVKEDKSQRLLDDPSIKAAYLGV